MRIMNKIFCVIITLCTAITISGCSKEEVKVMVDTNGMTDLQKAVVVTAESFYLRGNYAQYDMGDLYDKGFGGSMERRLVGVKAPEDYTAQNMGYTDCSGFVFDVYLAALDMEIISGIPWTKTYCESMNNTVLREKPAEWGADVDKVKKLKEFTDKLQPGDIMVYRYKNGTSGHAMLYVGNGMMIHSGGKSFNYKESKANYEQDGTYLYEAIADTLLKKGDRKYLADMSVYVIVRPLNEFKGEIPADTLSRMDVMRGIKAEKLASCSYGQTVAPNSEITFTFMIENCSNKDKTLTVTDTVPQNTQYVSGADEVDGNKLSWKVKVPAGKKAEVSYTVRVLSDTLGELIVSQSFVADVAVNCPEILVAKTLNKNEQAQIVKKAEELKASDKIGTALANEIYGKKVFSMQTAESMWDAVIDSWSTTMGEGLELSGLVPPNLYGGRIVGEYDKKSLTAQKRTRYLREDLLITGDIVARDNDLYLFTGDALLDLNSKMVVNTDILANIIAADRFAVLRPSMGF